MQDVEVSIFFERILDRSLDGCALTTPGKRSCLVISVHGTIHAETSNRVFASQD